MDNRDLGDLGEIKFLEYCVKCGYSVLVPFSGSNKTRYDFVVDTGEKLLRVQVKYISKTTIKGNSNINIQFIKGQNGRKTLDGKRKKIHYSPEEIDKFIVYCPDTDKLYDIPNNRWGSVALSLRIDNTIPKNNQIKRINYAKDFELIVL